MEIIITKDTVDYLIGAALGFAVTLPLFLKKKAPVFIQQEPSPQGNKQNGKQQPLIHDTHNQIISNPNIFQHPLTGRVAVIHGAFLWTLLFGCFYMAYKGAWIMAVVSFVLAVFSAGFSWLFIPFFAKAALRESYRNRGYLPLIQAVS